MVPSLVRMVIRQPELLVDHLGAYSELAREDLRRFRAALLHRLALGLVAVGCGLAGVVLAGMALLLWASGSPYHWAFVAVPLVPLTGSAAAALLLRARRDLSEPMERTWDQFDADLDLIRETRQ
ncbi:MAG: phage holin family protein [Rhodocyclaceae bacterium]|nr:phage holin family protein [Rhodocyclaceae bacterium]